MQNVESLYKRSKTVTWRGGGAFGSSPACGRRSAQALVARHTVKGQGALQVGGLGGVVEISTQEHRQAGAMGAQQAQD